MREKSRIEILQSFGSLPALGGSPSSLPELWVATLLVAAIVGICTSALEAGFAVLGCRTGLLTEWGSGVGRVSVLFVLTNLKYSATLSFFLTGLGWGMLVMWVALLGREMWLILEVCTTGDGADMRPRAAGASDFVIESSDTCRGSAG